jgi:hypothetical protein
MHRIWKHSSIEYRIQAFSHVECGKVQLTIRSTEKSTVTVKSIRRKFMLKNLWELVHLSSLLFTIVTRSLCCRKLQSILPKETLEALFWKRSNIWWEKQMENLSEKRSLSTSSIIQAFMVWWYHHNGWNLQCWTIGCEREYFVPWLQFHHIFKRYSIDLIFILKMETYAVTLESSFQHGHYRQMYAYACLFVYEIRNMTE